MRFAVPAALLTVALAAVLPAAGAPPAVGSSQFLVEGDPRLCPSPLCGGWWVALANRATTRCHDGVRRQRCYVARTVDRERHPTTVSIADGALVRAAIEPWTFDGIGELGVLVVAEVRTSVGRGSSGAVYRIRDNWRRCVRAPCFWIRASLVNTQARTTFSSLDLTPARLTDEQRTGAESALARGGLYARGRVASTADGGRVLRVSRVFLEKA